jgi:YVTN family beta-propeller protein
MADQSLLGQSQPSWRNSPKRSLTARISLIFRSGMVNRNIASTAKRRLVGVGIRGWVPVCWPDMTTPGHHPVALGDQLLDADLERVERRQLLADPLERRAGLVGLPMDELVVVHHIVGHELAQPLDPSLVLGKVVATIPLPVGPLGVGFGDGAVWAPMGGPDDNSPGTVARIDPRTNKVVATVKVGRGPFGIGVAGGAVWVANGKDRTISRIDPVTNKVVATIRVGVPSQDYRGLAAGPEGVFVLNGDNTVSRIDPATSMVVATIAVPNCCVGEVAVGLGGVWISNAKDGTVSRIDLATNKVATTIKVSAQSPFGIGIADGAVWVTSAPDSTVYRIDPVTNTVVARINVTGGNHSLAAGAGAVWVQGLDQDRISRIDPSR